MAHCTLVISAARNLCRRLLVFSFGLLVGDNLLQLSLVIATAKPFATLRNSHGFTMKPSHDRLPSLAHAPRSILLLLSPSILQYRSSPPNSGGYVLVYSIFATPVTVIVISLRFIPVALNAVSTFLLLRLALSLERRIDCHSSRHRLLFKLLRATHQA